MRVTTLLLLLVPISVSVLVVTACDNNTKKPENTATAPPDTAAATAATTTAAAATTTGAATPASTTLPTFSPEQLNAFAPIPEAVEKPVMDDETKLGQMLFFDTRLSAGNDVACVTCHDFTKSGADGQALSTGTKKTKTKRNTPTVVNAGGSFAQGWDARTTTIDDFVMPHETDPTIMGMTDDKQLATVLSGVPAYAAAFKKAFPDEATAVSGVTIGRALGMYTKKLFARSRWDKYLAGDKTALTDAELGGFAMFVEAGCPTCHQGKYIGATQTQKLGVAKPWPPPLGIEPGRFDVTKQEVDRGMFKVPSLRNVTKTGPWLHDGSGDKIEEVIRMMSRHQIGKELSDPQIKAIVTFLGTLTGDPPKELTTKPQLPAGGAKPAK